jgi:hypothetical protein
MFIGRRRMFLTGKSLEDFKGNWNRLELKILKLAGRKLDSNEAKNLITSAKLANEEFRKSIFQKLKTYSKFKTC